MNNRQVAVGSFAKVIMSPVDAMFIFKSAGAWIINNTAVELFGGGFIGGGMNKAGKFFDANLMLRDSKCGFKVNPVGRFLVLGAIGTTHKKTTHRHNHHGRPLSLIG